MLSMPIWMRRQVPALLATMLFAATLTAVDEATAQDSLSLTPASLTNGAPCLITVSLHDQASAVTGQWQGHPVMFFSGKDQETWFALAGIDVGATPGAYPLVVEATLKDGMHRTLHQDVRVGDAPYEKVPLSVPDKFVEPNAAALKKIADRPSRETAMGWPSTVPVKG